MTTRRALLAALLVPAVAAEARGFQLVPADAETERLVADRALACSPGGEHAKLREDLLAALARAGDDEQAAAAVARALGTCPWCGCGLAPLAKHLPGQEDTAAGF